MKQGCLPERHPEDTGVVKGGPGAAAPRHCKRVRALVVGRPADGRERLLRGVLLQHKAGGIRAWCRLCLHRRHELHKRLFPTRRRAGVQRRVPKPTCPLVGHHEESNNKRICPLPVVRFKFLPYDQNIHVRPTLRTAAGDPHRLWPIDKCAPLLRPHSPQHSCRRRQSRCRWCSRRRRASC